MTPVTLTAVNTSGPPLASKADVRGETFARNAAAQDQLRAELHDRLAAAALGLWIG